MDDRTNLYTYRLVFYTIVPIVVIIAIFAVFELQKALTAKTRRERQEIRTSAIFYVLFFTFLCFVSVSSAVLQTFAKDVDLEKKEGVCYLKFDYSTVSFASIASRRQARQQNLTRRCCYSCLSEVR